MGGADLGPEAARMGIHFPPKISEFERHGMPHADIPDLFIGWRRDEDPSRDGEAHGASEPSGAARNDRASHDW